MSGVKLKARRPWDYHFDYSSDSVAGWERMLSVEMEQIELDKVSML